MPITSVRRKKRFQKEYDDLTPDMKQEVDDALVDLLSNPIPARRRFHSLEGYRNPKLFTIDVTGNKSHKISLEIDGTVATLRRIATHKEIDRGP